MPPAGVEPAASATAPQTVTQLPKTTISSFISFSGASEKEINEIRISFISFTSFLGTWKWNK